MGRFATALIFLVLILASTAKAASQLPGDIGSISLDRYTVRMTMITRYGHVSFKCGADWVILAAHGKPPAMNMTFQLDNRADRGTAASTNLAFTLVPPENKDYQNAIRASDKRRGTLEIRRGNFHDWETLLQEGQQEKTTYMVFDATKPVADVTAHVRLSWPILEGNPGNYNEEMVKTFYVLLDSVAGGMGKYQSINGEVFQRQN